ncbi:helix-turn-helix transcriptional regulator [Actinoplanes sp. M2I2]|uniref:helix-turn-helix transcriptional regulator n=1 Tax=Actinoplanes sp. M2I2 TaxID=1734444 RepID=UPI0020200FDD|nr:helix-turn-helix transcriptional regulator [Actinoplanes sp. M2I2]
MAIDRIGLADFLRRRREFLQPEDVGLPRGIRRRRTSGLRREEAAGLCHMSTDYYSRLEQGRGPHPSEQMIASIARGFHLVHDECDHLLLLAGHHPAPRTDDSDQISPGMLRVLSRLHDTPAEITNELGETLRQNAPGIALTGNTTHYTGPARSIAYRWFTDPATRQRYAAGDHDFLSRLFASGTREIATLRGPDSRAARLAELLLARSEEFRTLWHRHEVGLRPHDGKNFIHPELGRLKLDCQILLDPVQAHYLHAFTAPPDTESYEKLRLLTVGGSQPTR